MADSLEKLRGVDPLFSLRSPSFGGLIGRVLMMLELVGARLT